MGNPDGPSPDGVVRFVLDGEIRELRGLSPTRTVLEYLRGEYRCGTKEGCAEGDCGACTVVLGELADDAIRYRAVNACILFAATLDGKELITVESLERAGGRLHPVQQAMVEHHGSQCGFCTPGFVMSLFALYHSGAPCSRSRINDALAGNLCRCTGYRPIVSAAQASCGAAPDDAFIATTPQRVEILRSIARRGTLAIGGGEGQFFAPTTVAELARLFQQHPDAHLLAGGTDVGLLVTKQHRKLATVIYLGGVVELRQIAETEGTVEIGAAVPYVDVHAALAARYRDFGELIRRLGCVQIRNVGTIGGNIGNASPIGDTPPLLIALDAVLVLRRGGEQRELPIEDFFVAYRKTALRPGEFIECVRVPLPRPGWQFGAYKIAKRFDQDISAVCGAFAVKLAGGRVEDIRLCFGGVAATPKRAHECEAALIGGSWNGAALDSAIATLDGELAPISDMRASAQYRRLVAGNLLRKFHLETTGVATRTRLLPAMEGAR
jgi:xanthine dehydrogenase small subunit